MDIREIDRQNKREGLPAIEPGDTVKVYYRIQEGSKSRVQVYEGVVLQMRGAGMGASFTVRKISFQVSVERVFPLHSPLIEKVEIVGKAKVRRAKLYYLRERRGKAARLKPRRTR